MRCSLFKKCLMVLNMIFMSSLLYGNVLQNPGFEAGMTSWQVTAGSVSIMTDTMGIRNGTKSLLTTYTTSNELVGFKQTGVSVLPNTWYRLTVHSKVEHSLDWSITCGYVAFWSRFYVDGEEIYYVNHNWYTVKWLQDDWTIFNTGSKTTIDMTIERYATSFPPATSGIVYDDIILAPYDTIRPRMLSAVASDGIISVPGIDDDDYVTIAFNEATNKIPPQRCFDLRKIIEHPVDIAFKLINGHTWLDGNGKIKKAEWNAHGDTVIIYLTTNGGLPTIAVGDTIRPGRCEILDESGNPILRDLVILTGSFGVIGVEEITTSKTFALLQNNPNPFNSSTTINYQLPEDQFVELQIYTIYGGLVKTLIDRHQTAGHYIVYWNGKDELERKSPSGIYFYKLKTEDFIATKKMILLGR